MQPSMMHQSIETIEQNKNGVLLTKNGFTSSEELEILRIVERMHRGEEKIYSAEEASHYLELDD
jgi:hypothetical protein